MRFLFLIASLLGLCAQVHGKAVFAHFMLSNTDDWIPLNWEAQMMAAAAAKLDGFAINFAKGESVAQFDNAFSTARQHGLKLFFSFDYAGNAGAGPWEKASIIDLVNKWKSHPAYFKHEGTKPLVSTFEGPDNASDWGEIKAATGCFFMPDWSSVGAMQAWAKQDGRGGRAADGLFNWAAWPAGGRKMDTYVDASYLEFMGGEENGSNRLYMMPVSPWFYTHLPQYKKNWVWNSDDAWYHRWIQVLRLEPEYIQIISWNDFGESHYIGPLWPSPPMSHPDTPFDYTRGMNHIGWLKTLPYWIDMYKMGTTLIERETIVAWYTKHTGLYNGRNRANTTINTATHLQLESDTVDYGNFISFDAVLGSNADVGVSIGRDSATRASWTDIPHGGVGIYHAQVYIGNRRGTVEIKIIRNGRTVFSMTGGVPITDECEPGGYKNFNARVDWAESPAQLSSVCTMTCGLGYCPTGACVCTNIGAQPTLPDATGTRGYTRGDPSFIGLCSFACNYGLCMYNECDTEEHPIVMPSVSPFLPDSCNSGEGRFSGQRRLDELCQFACQYGHCPISVCKCNSYGALNDINLSRPKQPGNTQGVAIGRYTRDIDVNDMCAFTCAFGFCPPAVCELTGDGVGTPTPDPLDDDSDDEDDPICDATSTDLDALVKDADKIPALCAAQYILPILSRRLQAAKDRYDAMLRDGYDRWLDIYSDYIVQQAPAALVDLLNNHGNEWFTCQIVEPVRCCTMCGTLGKSCKYCVERDNTSNPFWDVCDFKSPYNADSKVMYRLVPQPCPPDVSQRGEGGPHSIIWNSLPSNRENAFYAKVQESVGAGRDKVTWDTHAFHSGLPPYNSACVGKGYGYENQTRLRCSYTGVWFNAPSVRSLEPEDIVDPKQVLDVAMENTRGLAEDLAGLTWEHISGTAEDLVHAVSLAVFMLEDAVAYMQKVVDMGRDIDDANKQHFLLNLLSAVFMVIPMAGQLVATATLRPVLQMLGRAMLYAGEAGGVGLTINGVVDDPSSAPWLVFNLIMSTKSIRDAELNIQASNIARKMTYANVHKFSAVSAAHMQKVRDIMRPDGVKKVCSVYG
ncbi:Glycosyl hydrolase family 71 domain containing protein [Rhypophila sp. PSN 637]